MSEVHPTMKWLEELRAKTLHDVGWASVGELHEAYVSEMEENERLRNIVQPFVDEWVQGPAPLPDHRVSKLVNELGDLLYGRRT